MRRSIISVLTVAAFGVTMIKVVGCGNSSTAASSNKSPAKKKTPKDDDDASGSASGGTTCGSGLALSAGASFDTVNGFLSTNCTSCHPGAGGSKDYHKYSDVKADGQKIIERLKRDKSAAGYMPQGGLPDPAEIAKFQAWLDGGTQPEGPIAGSTSGGTSGGSTSGCASGASSTTTTGSSTGGTTTGTGTTGAATAGGTTSQSTAADPDPAFFEPIINPPKKLVCHNQKQPFQHSNAEGGGDCVTDAKLLDKTADGFDCTHDGIMGKYSNDANVAAALDPLVKQGKSFDDCGISTDGKKLVVFMFCLSDQAGTDTPNCVELAKLDGKTVFPKTSKVQIPYPP